MRLKENLEKRVMKVKERHLALFPPLDREGRLILVEHLTEGSRWNMNFGGMFLMRSLIDREATGKRQRRREL